ncbi:hypothetical protein OPT61_g7238 [Boeremia exigua]|uniref:Uncharacterized protein n=1 Tax=Boeremia exigua TaxID=749465 RepID=A0ACC2I330_9PLEO|nr:hypothetical protein OPT61_g7238 [Boeremia exigua]
MTEHSDWSRRDLFGVLPNVCITGVSKIEYQWKGRYRYLQLSSIRRAALPLSFDLLCNNKHRNPAYWIAFAQTATMSNQTSFSPVFSLFAHHRRGADAQHARRERQTRTPSATGPSASRNGSITHSSTDGWNQASISTIIPTLDLSSDALGSSDAWTLHHLEGQCEHRSVADAIEQTLTIFKRIGDAEDYLDSAESSWDELCIAGGRLQTALEYAPPLNEQLRFKAMNTLGCIHSYLGDNDRAQSTFLSLCPPLPLDRAAFTQLHAWHKIDALLDYIRFLTSTSRDLDQVVAIAKLLPWATPPEVLRSQDRKSHALLSLVQALNKKGRHAEASETLVTFELISAFKDMVDSRCLLQKAIAAAGQGSREEAEFFYVDAFVVSSLTAGAWHVRTLHTLYQFGRALRAWREDDSAIKVLLLCCQGRKRKWSMAYERCYLTTPIEMLRPEITIDYDRLADTLETLLRLKSQSLSRRAQFDVQRNLAWCDLERKKLDLASTSLYKLHQSMNNVSSERVSIEAHRATLAADKAICSARSAEQGADFMRQRSKMVYLGLKDFPKARSHQVKAMIRRLTTYKLTHFTRDALFSEPPLVVETNQETLGSGSSAVVDTVQIGQEFYARKLVNLPRQNQRQLRLREELQKEIAIIHALDHPHIVRVLLTYEGARHFSIIMHPLADCDLETYLVTNICDTNRKKNLVWKWMTCLVNTLAFIHSRDIRHKDIKPRNLLIKGERIYFADFGSGHMFSDSGNSTTDGPSFGHTKAYCAPEVIKSANRNRSSDVFSLGCVLTEMAAWGSKISISYYFTSISAQNSRADTILYHESLTRIKAWFEDG